MGSVDEVLKSVGEAVDIIRTGGNISTYLYINPKGSFERSAPYERNCMMPTDSGVVSGDLIQHGSNYYLVVNLFEDRRVGEFFNYKARLFKCNATVTVKVFNSSTGIWDDYKTGVPCLIASPMAGEPDDRGIVYARQGDSDNDYRIFIQTSSGVGVKNSRLVDQDGRKLRLEEVLDPYTVKGLLIGRVMVENA